VKVVNKVRPGLRVWGESMGGANEKGEVGTKKESGLTEDRLYLVGERDARC